ncbi:MAG: hypothetical protein HUU15_12150 [Candidatus Brocadiae bacterium]|nr:hypothetical protein [Candidatus Brocadiia bacterium]
MPLRPIDKIQPGMRTASPVTDEAGMLLLAQGVTLTAESLDLLRKRRVTAVEVVETGPATDSPKVVQELPANIEAELEHAFGPQAGHPVMKAILDAALDRVRTRRGGRP